MTNDEILSSLIHNDEDRELCEELTRRLAKFPSIGIDPLSLSGEDWKQRNSVQAAREALSKINAIAQPGVPDQTALVWRADLNRLIGDHIWRSCHLEPMKKAHAELAFLKRCCRVVYYPPDGSYPIEHAPGAGKDQFDEILRRQEPAMIPGGSGDV